MTKRLFSWLFRKPKPSSAQSPLRMLLQDVAALKRTLRRQAIMLEQLHTEWTAFSQREGQQSIESLLACSEAFFHLDQSLRQGEHFTLQHDQALSIVWGRLDAVLRAAEVNMIRQAGVVFDPRRHEAVQTTGTGNGEIRVVQVVQPGYCHQDRILRPAKTIIGTGAQSKPPTQGVSE